MSNIDRKAIIEAALHEAAIQEADPHGISVFSILRDVINDQHSLAIQFSVALIKSEASDLNDIPKRAWELAERFTAVRLDHVKSMDADLKAAKLNKEGKAN